MNKFRIGSIVFASIIIIAHLILTDYGDLSWSNNSGNYLGIVAMICVLISMILSKRDEQRKGE